MATQSLLEMDEETLFANVREDLLLGAELLWLALKRTKKDKKRDVALLATYTEAQHKRVLSGVTAYVSDHTMRVAKSEAPNEQAKIVQGLLVRALAELANRISLLQIIQETKNDAAGDSEGKTLPVVD